MALILLCEEVIEPTASAVMCVKNDRICDIIFQLYVSAWCQIIHLTMARTESENSRLVPFSATKNYLEESDSHGHKSERKKF